MAKFKLKKKTKKERLETKYDKKRQAHIDKGTLKEAKDIYGVKTPFKILAKKKIAKRRTADEAIIDEHGGKNIHQRQSIKEYVDSKGIR
mgnify:CR=1 FL=1